MIPVRLVPTVPTEHRDRLVPPVRRDWQEQTGRMEQTVQMAPRVLRARRDWQEQMEQTVIPVRLVLTEPTAHMVRPVPRGWLAQMVPTEHRDRLVPPARRDWQEQTGRMEPMVRLARLVRRVPRDWLAQMVPTEHRGRLVPPVRRDRQEQTGRMEPMARME